MGLRRMMRGMMMGRRNDDHDLKEDMMNEDPGTRMLFNGKLHGCMALVFKLCTMEKVCILHSSACS